MAMINYADKVALNSNSNIADINKVKADDMNELKNAFNNQVSQGWYKTGINPTFTFVSWGSTTYTGVVSTNIDLTPYLNVGMKIKFTQSSTIKYGIITAINSSTITIFMGTQYTLENTTISDFNYSIVKCPYGFPMNKSYWSIISVSTTIQKIDRPVNGTWYNIGSFSITLPAGNWDVNYQLSIGGYGSNKNTVSFSSTLSTLSTSASDNRFVSMIYLQGASSTMNYVGSIYRKNNINLTQNTTYYLLTKTAENDILCLYNYGGLAETMVIAECAYL